MAEKQSNGLLYTILAFALVSVILSGAVLFGGEKEISVPTPVITSQDKAEIASLVVSNLPQPSPVDTSVSTPVNTETQIVISELSEEDKAYLKDASDLDEKNLAEALATEEISTKSFLRDLTDFLNTEGTNIESWKDIESTEVKDVDVRIRRDTATVTFDIRVYYFEDGDIDDDVIESARVKSIFTVDDVGDDSDSEVSGWEFEFIKFYD
jgi:hypothetical protein